MILIQERNAQNDGEDQNLVQVILELVNRFLVFLILICLNEHTEKPLEKGFLTGFRFSGFPYFDKVFIYFTLDGFLFLEPE